MTWEQIKQTIQVIYSPYVGAGKLIDDTDDGLSPSQLSLLVNLVHGRISSFPIDFEFCKETGTLPLTGASSYNLATLFPGFKTIFQVYGINQYQEHQFYGNGEANITPLDGWTMKGKTLVFTGTPPTGTAQVQFKSSFMVKNSSGTRQQYFLAEDDVSVLDDDSVGFIIFGLGDYINWSSDTENQDRKAEVKDWFKEAMNNLVLNNGNSKSLDSML